MVYLFHNPNDIEPIATKVEREPDPWLANVLPMFAPNKVIGDT